MCIFYITFVINKRNIAMVEIIKLDHVDKYNKLFGLETLHPMVAVVDLSKATRWPTHFKINYGVYALFLKDTRCGDIMYGRQPYDYQEGTIVCFAPGQVAETEMQADVRPSAHGILFHPDFIHGTPLGQEIKKYSFFSYETREALHISEEERGIIMDCFRKITMEVEHAIDKHSRRLITANIGLLLDYCMRFYERQFTTREASNKDIISRFERLLDEYFDSEAPQEIGLPSVRYFAEKVFLSPNYFGCPEDSIYLRDQYMRLSEICQAIFCKTYQNSLSTRKFQQKKNTAFLVKIHRVPFYFSVTEMLIVCDVPSASPWKSACISPSLPTCSRKSA